MIRLFLILSLITLIKGTPFSEMPPSRVFEIGKYMVDNVAPNDSYKNNIQSGGALSGNANYLLVGNGRSTVYGHFTMFSYNSTSQMFNTYEYAKYGVTYYASSLDIADSSNNAIVHKGGTSTEGFVISTPPSVSSRTISGDNLSCQSGYPCDSVAMSLDGSLYVAGWPASFQGSPGASGQSGFLRLYTCSSTCSAKQSAWPDGSTANGSFNAQRGRDDMSYYGQSVDVSVSPFTSEIIILAGAPGNMRQEDGAEYPSYDFGGNNGAWLYGGYAQLSVYRSGLNRALSRLYPPDASTTAAVNNQFGSIVRMSKDGEWAFVTAPGTQDGGNVVGAFYAYTNVQNGGDDDFIFHSGPYYGPTADEKFGWAMEVSPDGSRVFIGAPDANSGDGKVYLYNYAKDTDDFVFQGDFVDSASGHGGELGSSLHYDNVREVLYAGNPKYPDYLTYTEVGSVNVYDVPAPPTPSPTMSPTPPTMSPTMSPTVTQFIVVGTAEVQANVLDGDAREEVVTNTIADVTADFEEDEVLVNVQSTEVSLMPLQLYNDVNNETLFKESFLNARGNPEGATVTISTDGRRMLQEAGSIVVELTFDLTEDQYNDLVANGNNLDDPEFLNEFSSELGVDPSNVTVTVVEGEVIIEVSLITAVDSGDPSGAETLEELQEIQASLDNATEVLVEELGSEGDSVTTIELDLCGSRDCSGRGDPTAPDTDANGCNPTTGVCACIDDWWGINCESECECFNGGYCRNSYCQCEYPYYGIQCNSTIDCSCN